MKIAAALLSLLALGLVQPVSAATVPAAVAAADGQVVIDANARLAERIAATAPGKPLPMLSNDGAALVRAAYDAAAIRAVPLEDPETIGRICEALGGSLGAYAKAMEPDTHGDPAKVQAATLRLQSEFALGTVASVVCSQRGFRSIDALIAPVSADLMTQILPALDMMRTGFTMILEGSLGQLEIQGFTPANQDMILAALNEDNGVIAASYPAAGRRQRAATVRDAMRRVSPRLRPALERLARSFDAPDCNHICQASGG